MAAEEPFLAALLRGDERGLLAHGQAERLLALFLRVCAALDVTDPADPLAQRIARALIVNAVQGERDDGALYERTIARVRTESGLTDA